MTPFHPHPLLRNGHLQTAFAAVLQERAFAYSARQHLVPTTEGDRLVLHEDSPRSDSNDRIGALLIHGLAGSHRSPYVARIASKLASHGVRVFRLDLRGCGAGIPHARKPTHAGRSDDIAAAVGFIERHAPECQLTAIGFSLGGNQLLKLLGERPDSLSDCLERALAVAPPIDLLACSENLARRSRFVYDRWFVRYLNRSLQQRRGFDDALQDLPRSRPARTLYEFDDQVTAPLGGFSNAAEYYARSSAAPLLKRIQLPTTILTARDDPIVPVAIFDTASTSASTRIVATQHGGHVGFVGRKNSDPDRYWLDWRVVDFVTQSDTMRTPESTESKA